MKLPLNLNEFDLVIRSCNCRRNYGCKAVSRNLSLNLKLKLYALLNCSDQNQKSYKP